MNEEYGALVDLMALLHPLLVEIDQRRERTAEVVLDQLRAQIAAYHYLMRGHAVPRSILLASQGAPYTVFSKPPRPPPAPGPPPPIGMPPVSVFNAFHFFRTVFPRVFHDL